MPRTAPFNPVCDFIATQTGDGYGVLRCQKSGATSTCTRAGVATIQIGDRIVDVAANLLRVRPRSDGKSGFEALIEAARTNSILNSYFNADTDADGLADNWTLSKTVLGTIGKSIVTSGSPYGKAQRITYTADPSDSGGVIHVEAQSVSGAFTAGDLAVASCYVKGSTTGSVVYYIQANAYNGGTYLGTNQVAFTPTSSWQRVESVYASLPATTNFVRIRIKAQNIDAGDAIDIQIAAAQLEKGSTGTGLYASSYIPTTTAAVTRNDEVVTIPTTGWNRLAGSMVAVLPKPVSGTSYNVSWWLDNSNTIGIRNTLRNIQAIVYTAGTSYASTPATFPAYGAFGMSWAHGEPVRGYVDGVADTPSGNCAVMASAPATAFVGMFRSSPSVISQMNSAIQRLVVYDYQLDAAQQLAVANAVKNGPKTGIAGPLITNGFLGKLV